MLCLFAIIQKLLIVSWLPFIWLPAQSPVCLDLTGVTMGTRYTVSYFDEDDSGAPAMHSELNRLFQEIDQQLSNWNPHSWVSQFNHHKSLDPIAVPAHAAAVLQQALEIADLSAGALDPTLSPLIELWGFGAAQGQSAPPLAFELEQALLHCGYQKLKFDVRQRMLRKQVPDLQLNLSAVAKGYAVDQVAQILVGQGHEDYLIHIGGEVRANGKRADGRAWKIRIVVPQSDGADSSKVVILRDGAIATSGDTQRFFEYQGRRYAHLIDPRSGYPVDNRLHSVSVRAQTCAQADAWATACSVLGREAGMAFIESLDGVEALFWTVNATGHLVSEPSSAW